jgi:hypothetical protein
LGEGYRLMVDAVVNHAPARDTGSAFFGAKRALAPLLPDARYAPTGPRRPTRTSPLFHHVRNLRPSPADDLQPDQVDLNLRRSGSPGGRIGILSSTCRATQWIRLTQPASYAKSQDDLPPSSLKPTPSYDCGVSSSRSPCGPFDHRNQRLMPITSPTSAAEHELT